LNLTAKKIEDWPTAANITVKYTWSIFLKSPCICTAHRHSYRWTTIS